jgi:DnaJ-class molecular chaperone
MALKDNRIYVIFTDGETIELNDDPRINQGNLISLREMGMADRPSGKFLITRKTVEPSKVDEPGEIRYFVEAI